MANELVQVLVVDDDPALMTVMQDCLKMVGDYDVRATGKAREAMAWMEGQRFDIVVTDYSLGDPEINGLGILERSQEVWPSTLGIIVTAYASLEVSLEAIRLGTYDFLTKPFQLDELKLAVRNAADRVRLNRENSDLRDQVTDLAKSVARLETEHRRLMENMTAVQQRLPAPVGMEISVSPVSQHGSPELIQAYMRRGETIGEQLDRESRKLEALYERGLITEPDYKKWLERKQDAPPA